MVEAKEPKISLWQQITLASVPAGLAIIQVFALNSASFRRRYATILKQIVDIAEIVKPYVEANSEN